MFDELKSKRLVNTVFAKKSPELDNMSEQIVERVSQKYSSARASVKNAYDYCTISASSVKWGFFDDDHRRGLAVHNQIRQ